MSKQTKARPRRAGAQAASQVAAPKKATEGLPRALPALGAAALVFVAAGTVLMLEILAVRLLAPYVGLTLETTTAIIGAALAGIAAGAAIGGQLADRTNTRRLIVLLLIGGGVLALLIVPIVHLLGPGARGSGEFAALGITFVTLVPAAAALSAISPAVAHLQLHDLRASGTVVGRLSAWGTAGALLGTFGTGFVLVPLMPVSTAVLVIGGALVLIGVALGASSNFFSLAGAAAIVVLAVLLGGWANGLPSPCKAETRYHCVSIEPAPGNPGAYELVLDDQHHSYVDLRDPTHLGYRYTRWIAHAIDGTFPAGKPLNVVFVGGGGFTLPRWLDATRPGSQGLVLEVDGELVQFDEEHLGLRETPGLRIRIGDARVDMLDVPSHSADVVVGDAFGNRTVPWHLATTEWMEEVQRVLKPGGLFAANVVDLPPLELQKAEAKTLLQVFPHVRLVSLGFSEHPAGGNAVILASNKPISPSAGTENAETTTLTPEAVESFASGAQVLTDDYAPTDQLITSP